MRGATTTLLSEHVLVASISSHDSHRPGSSATSRPGVICVQRYPADAVPDISLAGNTRCVVEGRIAFEHGREVALNQQVKDLIQKLGEAIHESVSESDQIAGVVREIKEQGFDVMLMLEATIGLNGVEDAEETTVDEGDEIAEGSFTRNDLSFLKSLRISTEQTEHDAGQDAA